MMNIALNRMVGAFFMATHALNEVMTPTKVSEGLKSDRLKTMKTAVNLYFDIRQICMMRSDYYRAKTIVYMQYVF